MKNLLFSVAMSAILIAGPAVAYDDRLPSFGGAPFDHQYDADRGPAFGGALFDREPEPSFGSTYDRPSYGAPRHHDDDD